MTQGEMLLCWSGEDDAFIAEVPELPGCAADGPSRQEALANVEIVIDEWLATAQELGRCIPVARHTHLDRAVAIRLLAMAKPSRQQRFARKAASALNHFPVAAVNTNTDRGSFRSSSRYSCHRNSFIALYSPATVNFAYVRGGDLR